MRAVLAAVQERRDRRHAAGLAELVKNVGSFASNLVTEG